MDNHRASDDRLIAHIEEEDRRQKQIEQRLSSIESSMADMINVWTQAKGALTFIKVLAGFGAALAGIYAFLNGHFSITPK